MQPEIPTYFKPWSLSGNLLPLSVACSAICQGSLDRQRKRRGERKRESHDMCLKKKRNEDTTDRGTFGKVIFPRRRAELGRKGRHDTIYEVQSNRHKEESLSSFSSKLGLNRPLAAPDSEQDMLGVVVLPKNNNKGNFLEDKAALHFGSGKFRFILPIY